MASTHTKPWYLRKPDGWKHFQAVPVSRLWSLFLAVFALFSTFGFYSDLMGGGHTPYGIVLWGVLQSGLIAMLWILVLARLPMVFIIVPLVVSIISPWLMFYITTLLMRMFPSPEVASEPGIHFAATGTMVAIIASYVLFVIFIRSEGKESFKLRNELALAHGIQKTLVPPVTLRTIRFEVYGVSHPSEQVGGDLVDALCLPGGDAIAYLADIAGHGLQAGILMGMLKTATRTALLDAGEREPSRTLPVLLDRLNSVLPAVKEPHMYATFTGLRLGQNGDVYYALAASPPILHWHANGAALSHLEEEQFPLGLLPISGFDGQLLKTGPGDLLVVATDGILEVCDKGQEEYGAERLKRVIEKHAQAPLAQLAERILESANGFGRQADDQTILIVRCL
jgi:serine phosphatase RsbU (regulator of sigma subunit)